MTTVYLVRHGQTDTNIFNGINGSASNQPLNETGLEMAANLTAVFENVPLDAIYASTLTRAIQTAEGVRGTRDMEIKTDADLCEIDFGYMDGMSGKEAAVAYPQESWIWNRHAERFQPPGSSESLKSFRARVTKAFLRIVRENRGKRVAVVGHGLAFLLLMGKLLGVRLHAYRLMNFLSNTGYCVLQIEDDGHVYMDALEHREHLKPGWELPQRRLTARYRRVRREGPRRVFYAPLKMRKKEQKTYEN